MQKLNRTEFEKIVVEGIEAIPEKFLLKLVEKAARDEKDIKEIVKNTVWHEIAHHFGMSEDRVRQAEARRRR